MRAPIRDGHVYTLSERSLEELRQERIPGEIFQRIQSLKDQSYQTEHDLLRVLTAILFVDVLLKKFGKSELERYRALIAERAKPYTKQNLRDWLELGDSLENADLERANLVGIHIPKINLKGANLKYADLRYANLAGTILEGACLEGANLLGAKLTGANLVRANLKDACLDNADLAKALLYEACFHNATLLYTSLRGAEIEDADFTEANLQCASLLGTKRCVPSQFKGADLRGARFDYARLDGVELKEVGAKLGDRKSHLREKGLLTKVFSFPAFNVSFWER